MENEILNALIDELNKNGLYAFREFNGIILAYYVSNQHRCSAVKAQLIKYNTPWKDGDTKVIATIDLDGECLRVINYDTIYDFIDHGDVSSVYNIDNNTFFIALGDPGMEEKLFKVLDSMIPKTYERSAAP